MRSLFCLLLAAVATASAQFAPFTGLHDNTPAVHAFTNARIVLAPGRVIARGTLVVRDGVVEAAGEKVSPPPDARIWDMAGLTLYPGFIDLSSDYGLPKAAAIGGEEGPAQTAPAEKPKGAEHWTRKMRADLDVSAAFQPDQNAAEKLRSQGFAAVLCTPQSGIFRGQNALVSLADAPGPQLVLKRQAAQTISFEQRDDFFGGYPNSLMGVIAFTRQTFNDADWYRRAWQAYAQHPDQPRPETSTGLAALADAIARKSPIVGEASDDQNVLRLLKISAEFSLNLWIRGCGEEYRRLAQLKESRPKMILPLNFPEPPNVDAPEEALAVTLEDLQHWDAAPENAGRLEKAGIPLALTASQLKDPGTFLGQLRKAVQRGLSPDGALAALTVTPAAWLGLDKQLGSLETGRAANIVVTDGDLFATKTKIREVWIDGKRYEVKVPPTVEARGTWSFSGGKEFSGDLVLKGDPDKPTGSLRVKGKDLPLSGLTYAAGRMTWSVSADSVRLADSTGRARTPPASRTLAGIAGMRGSVRISGTVRGSSMNGVGEKPDGTTFAWSAALREPFVPPADTAKPKPPEMASFVDKLPPGEFGREKPPDQPKVVLVKNATIWTEGKPGKIEKGDMLIRSGKIERIGENLTAPAGAVVIDAAGKHVTPGIIDCHSHTASASVNEGGKAVTCETRIADVLDPDDIWIYRQLAGGTTMANVLHGSANPIGGQNAGRQVALGLAGRGAGLRRGAPWSEVRAGREREAEQLQPGGRPTGRYPATRMGVEQIIRDRFSAARNYSA